MNGIFTFFTTNDSAKILQIYKWILIICCKISPSEPLGSGSKTFWKCRIWIFIKKNTDPQPLQLTQWLFRLFPLWTWIRPCWTRTPTAPSAGRISNFRSRYVDPNCSVCWEDFKLQEQVWTPTVKGTQAWDNFEIFFYLNPNLIWHWLI